MSIGDDVKDVLTENGTSFTGYKLDGTTITGEYLDYETSYDSSTEFIRQFTLSASFSYDTSVEQGDIVAFGSNYYLVMNLKPERFENAVVENGGFLVQCNCYGKFMRKAINPDRNSNYEITSSWNNQRTTVRALMYENVLSGITDTLTGSMEVPSLSFVLLTQNFTDVIVGDRWLPDFSVSTVYYRVSAILTKKYAGLNYMLLEKDVRE